MVRPYIDFDMTVPEDVDAWFDEMDGYLRTEDFVNQGTDHKGRELAYKAFLNFKDLIKQAQRKE